MELRDAVAEIVYKAIRENPDKFPDALSRRARHAAEFYDAFDSATDRYVRSATWEGFKERIKKSRYTGDFR